MQMFFNPSEFIYGMTLMSITKMLKFKKFKDPYTVIMSKKINIK